MIYWDTSCVLKLYTAESDSLVWQRQALGSRDEFGASALMEAEMAYALEQKELRGEVKPGGAQALLRLFSRDLQAGRFALAGQGRGADLIVANNVLLSRGNAHRGAHAGRSAPGDGHAAQVPGGRDRRSPDAGCSRSAGRSPSRPESLMGLSGAPPRSRHRRPGGLG